MDHVYMAVVCRQRMAGHFAYVIQDGQGQHAKCKVKNWQNLACIGDTQVACQMSVTLCCITSLNWQSMNLVTPIQLACGRCDLRFPVHYCAC